MTSQKYHFEKQEDLSVPRVHCPYCGEILSPADIEGFWQCPYCGKTLEHTQELEDFVIEPLIRQWTARYPFSRGGER